MKRLKVALDHDVSPRMKAVLGELYGVRGFEFVIITEFSVGNADDEIWADAFKRFGGYIVISGDKQIGQKPHKARAFIDNCFASFFMDRPWSSMKGHLKAAHLVFWWPCIERLIKDGAYGRCHRVPCDFYGTKLGLEQCAFQEMKIPEEVLANAQKAQKAK